MASMTGGLPKGHPIIEWAWAGSALESLSGDLHVIVPYAGGALVALIDGLGHGAEAFEAARAALSVLEAQADAPVLTLMERCHEALRWPGEPRGLPTRARRPSGQGPSQTPCQPANPTPISGRRGRHDRQAGAAMAQ